MGKGEDKKSPRPGKWLNSNMNVLHAKDLDLVFKIWEHKKVSNEEADKCY